MTIIIDLSKCDVCGACVNACPAHAITRKGDTVVIDESLCTLCKRCFDVCPLGAISEEKSAKELKETLSLVPQNIEIIKAEPVPVSEKQTSSILGEIALKIIPRLLDGLISLIGQNKNTLDDVYKKKPKNEASNDYEPKRRRHQKRGRSGRT
jgi:ferredoxin